MFIRGAITPTEIFTRGSTHHIQKMSPIQWGRNILIYIRHALIRELKVKPASLIIHFYTKQFGGVKFYISTFFKMHRSLKDIASMDIRDIFSISLVATRAPPIFILGKRESK